MHCLLAWVPCHLSPRNNWYKLFLRFPRNYKTNWTRPFEQQSNARWTFTRELYNLPKSFLCSSQCSYVTTKTWIPCLSKTQYNWYIYDYTVSWIMEWHQCIIFTVTVCFCLDISAGRFHPGREQNWRAGHHKWLPGRSYSHWRNIQWVMSGHTKN